VQSSVSLVEAPQQLVANRTEEMLVFEVEQIEFEPGIR
jgi:hypothetical protein